MADAAAPGSSLEGIFIAEREGYWELRLRPTESFRRMLDHLEEVHGFCLAKKPSRVLLDLQGFQGPLSVTDRYERGNFGARLQGLVGRVAVIARFEQVDPQKFGATVAQNRGLHVDVFPHPDAALLRLLAS